MGRPAPASLIALRWSASALADLDRIASFNEEFSQTWARRVHHRITQRCASLTSLPFQGSPADGSMRKLSIPDVQYVVLYEPTDDNVTIHRVWSTRQNREQP